MVVPLYDSIPLCRTILQLRKSAYIRTEADIDKIRTLKPQMLIAFVLIWTAYVPVGYLYYSGGNNSRLISVIGDGMIFNGIIIVGCAVSLFLVFVSANAYSNATINAIAKSTFGVYLLHDNMYRDFIWDNLLKISTKFQNLFFPIIAIGIVVLIFISCSLIDYIRERLFNATIYRMDSRHKKM